MSDIDDLAKDIHDEKQRRARAKNWAAIVATGTVYKNIYILGAIISLLLLVVGIAGVILHWGDVFSWLLGIGFCAGVLILGGMTVVANVIQLFKK